MPDPVPKNPAGNEIMNIPLYSGSKKEDPEIWLDCVDNAQSTFNWTPEGKIGAATLRLSGSALLWLRAQRTGNVIYGHGEGKKDYAQFKRDFLARFRPLDDPLRSTEAMKDLHMMDGETINEFKDRVMIAIEKKNYTYDDKTTDAYKTVRDMDAYRSITIGMTGQLRRCLMSGSDPPKELETLMKQAVQAEAALRKTAAIPGMAGIMEVTGEQDPDPQPAEGNGSESADAAGVNGSVQEMINELAKIKKQFQCYGCKEYGHLRRDCPNVNKQQPQPPQQPQPGAGRGWVPRGGGGWNSRGGYSRGWNSAPPNRGGYGFRPSAPNWQNNTWRGQQPGRYFRGGPGYRMPASRVHEMYQQNEWQSASGGGVEWQEYDPNWTEPPSGADQGYYSGSQPEWYDPNLGGGESQGVGR